MNWKQVNPHYLQMALQTMCKMGIITDDENWGAYNEFFNKGLNYILWE